MTSRWTRVSLLALCLAVPAHAGETRAFVITSDFSSGGLGAIDLTTHAVSADVATVYSDARARWYQGRIYVVNRFGQDNIQVIDPALGYRTVRQFSTGNGSNPQDIAFVSPNKAYVSRLGSPNLLRVDPAAGDTLGSISLAAFADADGLPEADYMVRLGNRLFVELQRLVNFAPADSSLIAVIDTDADTVVDVNPSLPGVQAITLRGQNPVTSFGWDPASHRLLVGCVGNYGVLDGGIEWVDPIALRSDGYAITETALGGDVLDVVWGNAAESHAIVSDASFNTALVAWSAATGLRTGTLFAPGGFSLSDVERDDRGELYVCRNDVTAPGVYVFSAQTHALLAGPLLVGLPPQSVAFDAASDPAAVIPGAGRATTLALGAPRPNPARDATRVALTLDHAGDVRAEVLDPAGRRVRLLATGAMAAGTRELEWMLDDVQGHRVPAGLYFVRVMTHTSDDDRGHERSITRRVLVVR
jgi:hypothetical protein